MPPPGSSRFILTMPNSEMFSHQTEDEEREIIKIAVDTIRKGTGVQLVGSPAGMAAD